MNRPANADTKLAAAKINPIELIEIERQARAMRAHFIADATRAGWNWMVARLRRGAQGQTA